MYYLKNGYLDIDTIIEHSKNNGCYIIFITGGRGTGKTYGVLKYLYQSGDKFMLMRRTQTETDFINKPDFQPFNALNRDYNINVKVKNLSKGSAGFYNADIDEDKPKDFIGMTCALTTISSMRGFDASDVKTLLYDEFIPEKHKRPITGEGEALLNAYETINRNRELKGEEPLLMICLSNSNRLGNPVFEYLQLLPDLQHAIETGQDELLFPDLSIAIYLVGDSPISERKRDTILYKAAARTDFEKMALDNDFSDLAAHTSVKRKLIEYVPVISIDNMIYIYRHKSNRRYYVSRRRSGKFKREYGNSEVELKRFRTNNPYMSLAYMERRIDFEDFTSENTFRRLLTL